MSDEQEVAARAMFKDPLLAEAEARGALAVLANVVGLMTERADVTGAITALTAQVDRLTAALASFQLSSDTIEKNEAVIAATLIEHTRTTITGCHCGWSELGRSHADHVARVLVETLTKATETN